MLFAATQAIYGHRATRNFVMDDANAELNISEKQAFVDPETLGQPLMPEDWMVAFLEEWMHGGPTSPSPLFYPGCVALASW